MNNKLEYRETDKKMKNGLPIWKCLHDENLKAKYLEYNYQEKIAFYI